MTNPRTATLPMGEPIAESAAAGVTTLRDVVVSPRYDDDDDDTIGFL